MKVKRRKGKSLTQLRESLERRQLEMELDLLENQWNETLVDPSEIYRDPVTGEDWLPIGGAGVSLDDQFTMPFRNEVELRMIRQRARVVANRNPYAENLLNSASAFIIGKGHRYTATMAADVRDERAAKKIAKLVQRFLNKLVKANKWAKRQKRAIRRFHRDGEVFLRLFPQDDGMTLYRFVEPADVSTPPREVGDESQSFGVATDPDDIETVEGYWVNDELIPAEEIQHRKANVDANMKRGLSSLYIVRDHLDRALRLLRNMSTTVSNQTAISFIRHHKATATQIQNFASRAATATRFNQTSGKTDKGKKLAPGTTFDVKDGKTRYEFPATGLNASSPVSVLAAELRAIASSRSWPEFMIGSDNSNVNYASALVAENPAVKAIESEQDDWIQDDLELIWAAVQHAVNVGLLPKESLRLVEIEVEPPTVVARDPKIIAETDEILNRMRVKSPQTIASQHSLDYSQESQNFVDADDANLDIDALDKPLTTGPDVNSGDVVESELLQRVGGITGTLDILEKLNAKVIGPETAKRLLVKFKIANDLAEAGNIIDDSVGLPPADVQTQAAA